MGIQFCITKSQPNMKVLLFVALAIAAVVAEPEADPKADADAASYYGGYYGHPGYGYGYGYGLGHRGYYGGYYGLGHRGYYGYGHHYGKRSADAEPEAVAAPKPPLRPRLMPLLTTMVDTTAADTDTVMAADTDMVDTTTVDTTAMDTDTVTDTDIMVKLLLNLQLLRHISSPIIELSINQKNDCPSPLLTS